MVHLRKDVKIRADDQRVSISGYFGIPDNPKQHDVLIGG